MIHVERASTEDLPTLWEIDTQSMGNDSYHSALVHAVEQHHCLVAKRGWDAIGYAVREPNFFGYPFIARIVVHPQHQRQGVARALLAYAEKTIATDRLFAFAPMSNTAAHMLYKGGGYMPCGTLDAVFSERVQVFVKEIAR